MWRNVRPYQDVFRRVQPRWRQSKMYERRSRDAWRPAKPITCPWLSRSEKSKWKSRSALASYLWRTCSSGVSTSGLVSRPASGKPCDPGQTGTSCSPLSSPPPRSCARHAAGFNSCIWHVGSTVSNPNLLSNSPENGARGHRCLNVLMAPPLPFCAS